MKAAFVFFAAVASGFGFDALFGGGGAVPIAHGDVRMRERMGGDVVGAEVEIDLSVGPVEDGIHLEGFFLLLGEGSFRACRRLAAAQAGDPDIGSEFGEGAVHGLDFVDHRVAFEIGFPEFAIEGFLSSGADARSVGAEIHGPLLHEFFHVVIRLRKKVAGIHKYDRNFRCMVMDQVNHDRGLQAKGSRRDKAITISRMEKFEAIRSLKTGERSGEIWSGEHVFGYYHRWEGWKSFLTTEGTEDREGCEEVFFTSGCSYA